MKLAICCLLSLILVLAGYNASAQTDRLLKNEKPKYDFLLIKPVLVRNDQKLTPLRFSLYTKIPKQNYNVFTFNIPKGYKDFREPNYDPSGILSSILSEIYINNMHDRYPTNPSYHYYNNVRNK